MMIAAVTARLEARISELQHRVEGAAKFAELMKRGDPPVRSVSAFVLPLGITGRPGDAASGAFTQIIRETVAVVLIVQSTDRTGERAIDKIDEFVNEVIAAIAGWAPDNQVGVFELARGQLINFGPGRLAYQIEFAITDQLRIDT